MHGAAIGSPALDDTRHGPLEHCVTTFEQQHVARAQAGKMRPGGHANRAAADVDKLDIEGIEAKLPRRAPGRVVALKFLLNIRSLR